MIAYIGFVQLNVPDTIQVDQKAHIAIRSGVNWCSTTWRNDIQRVNIKPTHDTRPTTPD